ncbi:MAG: ADP-ribosylglycohydrolase family protein [Ignavibacterium sp.]|jgi:ADP-ribosylglycohydrolase|nr:ADP-ribosylglycohydrolase family protein [Ignavibacterium sp.]
MKISWLDLSDRIKYELQQREEEGNDVSVLRNEWNQIQDSEKDESEKKITLENLYQKIEDYPFAVENEYNEPSDWDKIIQICNFKTDNIPSFDAKIIDDRILGGWLGRSAGCLLGKPIEKTPRAGIKELLSSNKSWPINDYITGIGIPESLMLKYPWNKHSGKESLKENIECMTEDDDMNYPMINLSAFERFGEGFFSESIMQTWMENLPIFSTFTAERVAYANSLYGLNPPETAMVRNPYREWIGAQIRADLWGWISPDQPYRAAEYAWRDARVSHIRNGIYGEMFFASVIALAFKYRNIREIIIKSLNVIPPKSRFAAAINFVLSLQIEQQPWEETVDSLYDAFGKFHWVHTLNNAALVVAAVLSSKSDFEIAICNVVMGGWDTDSNGATVGSIIGTMIGAKKLPSKWINPLNNRIRSSLKGFDNSSLTELAKRTSALAKYKS